MARRKIVDEGVDPEQDDTEGQSIKVPPTPKVDESEQHDADDV